VLIDAGMNMREAAVAAMKINRQAGKCAEPTPATQIEKIITCIPSAIGTCWRAGPGETSGRLRKERIMAEAPVAITPETTIIDIISQYRETERVFKKLEEETGICVCCQGLFLPIGEAAKQFGFDLGCALSEIKSVIGNK
jgi:hypothetical protein